jgi:predicted nucleic acid-binding protein
MIVCLDTNIVIYNVEGDPAWKPVVDARIQAILAAGDSLAVSDVARLECLVGPLRSGDAAAFGDYMNFFSLSSIRMLPVTPATWEHAARIRASFGFSGLDALHLATAIEHGCGLFLTSDAQLARCTAIAVEVLT